MNKTTKTSQEWAATVAQLQEKRAALCSTCDNAKAAAEGVALEAHMGDEEAAAKLKQATLEQRQAALDLEHLDGAIKQAMARQIEAKEAERLAGAREQLPRIRTAVEGLDALEARLHAALLEVAACEKEFEALDSAGHGVVFTAKHQFGIDLVYSGQGPRSKPHLLQGDVVAAGVKYISAPTRVLIREGAPGMAVGFRGAFERLERELLEATGGAA
ncbi:TPA: hypothetical protein RUX96_001744 [Aeromonas dhakensis]|nr:hypothetical protein [Aeromonas dhakensis]